MAVIWVHAPFWLDDIDYHKLKLWLDLNWHVQVEWILIEIHKNRLYVNGEIANFENPEKLMGTRRFARKQGMAVDPTTEQWFTKIAIFQNEEDKVEFILRWL